MFAFIQLCFFWKSSLPQISSAISPILSFSLFHISIFHLFRHINCHINIIIVSRLLSMLSRLKTFYRIIFHKAWSLTSALHRPRSSCLPCCSWLEDSLTQRASTSGIPIASSHFCKSKDISSYLPSHTLAMFFYTDLPTSLAHNLQLQISPYPVIIRLSLHMPDHLGLPRLITSPTGFS